MIVLIKLLFSVSLVMFVLAYAVCFYACIKTIIDYNGNYEPNNCRWSTKKVQANNTRRNIYIEYNGKTKTQADYTKRKRLDVKQCLKLRK